MGCGPLVAAVGIALMLRLDAEHRLLDRALPGAADLLARPGRHGRAPDRDRAGRRRRAQRRHRLRRQQRDRARRRACCASPRSAPWSAPSTPTAWAAERGRDARGHPRHAAVDHRLGRRLPRRHRRSAPSLVAPRRRARAGRHPQPAPRGPLRGLRRGRLLRPGAHTPRSAGNPRRRRASFGRMADVTDSAPAPPASSRRCSTARPAGSAAPASPAPPSLLDRTCLDCDEPVVTTVLDRFGR